MTTKLKPFRKLSGAFKNKSAKTRILVCVGVVVVTVLCVAGVTYFVNELQTDDSNTKGLSAEEKAYLFNERELNSIQVYGGYAETEEQLHPLVPKVVAESEGAMRTVVADVNPDGVNRKSFITIDPDSFDSSGSATVATDKETFVTTPEVQTNWAGSYTDSYLIHFTGVNTAAGFVSTLEDFYKTKGFVDGVAVGALADNVEVNTNTKFNLFRNPNLMEGEIIELYNYEHVSVTAYATSDTSSVLMISQGTPYTLMLEELPVLDGTLTVKDVESIPRYAILKEFETETFCEESLVNPLRSSFWLKEFGCPVQ